MVAELAAVAPALAVAGALLGDREVEPHALQLRRVLLPRRQPGAVGAADQPPRVGDRVGPLERRARVARPRVEIVELDGLEALRRAPPDPAADEPRRAGTLACGRDVDRGLAGPARVLEAPQHQRSRPRLLRLGLERVDVADRVVAGGPIPPVARDHRDAR